MTSLKELLGITEKKAPEAIPIDEYFRDWKTYGPNSAGRLLRAFGTPKAIDTSKDERLGRIFANRTITVFPAFHDFFGIEETIMETARHFQSAADGLIAGRQIQLYYGPPGSGKSSFATRLRDLSEEGYMAVLAFKREDGQLEHSPLFESPLGLFQTTRQQAILSDTFGIPPGRFDAPMSPWAAAMLDQNGGDPTKFYVKFIPPSQARSVGIAKVAPGNSREGDVSSFIGIGGAQPSLDGYAYIGGLNRTTQGLLEIVEMFGATIANLEPLIGATQDCSYASAGIGELPYQGVIIAHANEDPWTELKGKSQNTALISRIREIPFPLCVRATEIAEIHAKYLARSEHAKAPRTPGALEFMAIATALTRVYGPSMTRVLAYDGRTPPSGREEEWSVPTLRARAREELRKEKRPGEGMGGLGRADFAVLDRAMELDPDENGLDEVVIFEALCSIDRERGVPTLGGSFTKLLDETLKSRLIDTIRGAITHAFIEKHDDVMRSSADRYFCLADAWIEDKDVKDPETGTIQRREWIEQELTKAERLAGIRNPKDFRYRLQEAVLRYRARNGERAPVWEALNDEQKESFERVAFGDTPKSSRDSSKNSDEDMFAIIAFGAKRSKELEEKHAAFVARMVEQGYTERQVRRFVDELLRHEARTKEAQKRR